MTQGQPLWQNGNSAISITARDLVAVAFRHRRVTILCLSGVLLGAVLAAIFLPKYEAKTKILVQKAERADPVVSAEQRDPVTQTDVLTEEELNSEVELLHSHDVLRTVVLACGLDKKFMFRDLFNGVLGRMTSDERIDKAVRRLDSELDNAEVSKKSNVIEIPYDSSDPQLAAHVLKVLDNAYMEKHAQVYRPGGQFEFFDQQTKKYKQILDDAESQLKGFANYNGETSPQVLRDFDLQKLADFNGLLLQTRSDIASTKQRIAQLHKETGKTPERVLTQDRTTDDAILLEQLKSTLLTLELKRTELLTKYQPDYPLVQEVDKQIAKARAEVEAGEKQPVRDKTTDANPTFTWIDGELAKANADLAAEQAREAALQSVVRTYQKQNEQLENEGMRQHDLLRLEKTAEENYLLYQQKREEARVTDALDKSRLLNVSIAEEPVPPALPSHSPLLYASLGLLLGLTLTTVILFMLEYANQSFRTPAEVESFLNIPVLAAVPRNPNGASRNGHGRNRNGSGKEPEVDDLGVVSTEESA
jgi:succinoglycan biosynthesis transport protein ExoP